MSRPERRTAVLFAVAALLWMTRGDLRFSSSPGDTRFQVLLPLTQEG